MPATTPTPSLHSTSFYHTEPCFDFPLLFAIISGFALVGTILIAFFWEQPDSDKAAPGSDADRKARRSKRIATCILAFWLIGPPLWFWFEYFLIFKPYGDFKGHFEYFKYGQEQSAKIWAGVMVFLYAVHKLKSPEKK